MTIDQQVESPAPRTARHRVATNHSKKGQSQSRATYSATSAAPPFSPQGSSMYNPDSPAASTFMETSPFSSPSVQPTLDPSIVAVHGSVPSSPNFKGMRDDRLKESTYFALPKPRNPNAPQGINGVNGTSGTSSANPTITTSPVAPIPAHLAGKESKEGILQLQLQAIAGGLTEKEARLPDHVRRTVKNGRVIAIDFDDVCSQSIPALLEELNEQFGTDITLDDMETYEYFQNRGWGSPAEAEQKLRQISDILPKALPVPGFVSALKHLHALGHPIHIVTARAQTAREAIILWLSQQGITVGLGDDDEVAAIWFTDSYGFQHSAANGKGEEEETLEEKNVRLREMWKNKFGQGNAGGLAKLKVLRAVNAALFIDDHHRNLEPIYKADPPVPCLLFGAYKWNAAKSGVSSPVELMSYEERMNAGVQLDMTEIDFEGGYLHRVNGWDEVIQWIKKWDVPGQHAHQGHQGLQRMDTA